MLLLPVATGEVAFGDRHRRGHGTAEEEAFREGLAHVARFVEVLLDQRFVDLLVVGLEVDRVLLERLDDRLRRVHPGVHRVVDALQGRHVDHAGGVARHHHARHREALGHREVATGGDRLGAPGDAFAALEQVLDEGVGLDQLQRIVD
ncbi:MAG TPA: hypothetical protein VLK88_17430 [Gemmatimonadales bacterium]|nr:hypothetical protein [Gemmatimonadales bacterium]